MAISIVPTLLTKRKFIILFLDISKCVLNTRSTLVAVVVCLVKLQTPEMQGVENAADVN